MLSQQTRQTDKERKERKQIYALSTTQEQPKDFFETSSNKCQLRFSSETYPPRSSVYIFYIANEEHQANKIVLTVFKVLTFLAPISFLKRNIADPEPLLELATYTIFYFAERWHVCLRG